MQKIDFVISILVAIGIVGIILLLSLDKSVVVLTPIVTTLVGYIVGIKKEVIAGMFKAKS
jgi:hypothetical protein